MPEKRRLTLSFTLEMDDAIAAYWLRNIASDSDKRFRALRLLSGAVGVPIALDVWDGEIQVIGEKPNG